MTVLRRIAPAVGAIAALVTLPAVDARADEPMSNEMRAEQLFHSGSKKFDSGDYEGACSDFAASLKVVPKLGTLLNVALCHETTGKLATAWSEFHHAAAWAAQNGQRERHDYAREHIESIEPRLPRVTLQLPATVALSAIDLDGDPLPEQRWYLPLYLDPGEHTIAVEAPGRKRKNVTFRVVDSPEEQIVIIPPLDRDTAPAAVDRAEGSPRLAGFVLVGIGAAAIATGAIAGVIALTAEDDSGVRTPATVSTIAFGAGAAALAAGGYILLTAGQDGPRVSLGPRITFATSF